MTSPNAKTTSPAEPTDGLLAATLRSRAAGARTSHELVASVMAGVDALPQARRWSVVPQRRILSLVLVGLVTIALVGLASFAGRPIPTPAPDPGVIAYAGATFGWNGDLTVESHAIFAVSGDGGEETRLVDVPGEPRPLTIGSPAEHEVRIGPAVLWSPDGTQIAFRLYNDAPGIYVMSRDGSGLRLLAESPSGWDPNIDESNASFAWSPDGDRIAFISPNRPAPSQPYTTFSGRLYVVNVDDGSPENVPREVTHGASGALAWSADGSRIAFGRSHATSSGVVVVNADGTGERALADTEQEWFHVGAIAWSPNGSEIAFVQERIHAAEPGDYLNVINADGSGLREVGGPWDSGCCFHGAFGGVLEWSGDGTLITIALGQRIIVVAADGSGEQLSLSGVHVAWSPDESRLVYSTSGPLVSGSDPPHWSSAIYVINVDGTGQRWLAYGDYPAWSRSQETE